MFRVKDLSYLMYWVGLVFDLRCLGRSIRRGKDGLKSLQPMDNFSFSSGLGRGIREWINNLYLRWWISLSPSSPMRPIDQVWSCR